MQTGTLGGKSALSGPVTIGTARGSGAFANLADGAIIKIGRNKLQASYAGGDGNDLTLTVVR
ncbi:MAG TPA: hypothetical protein VGG02_03125 [Chthoniobacterales bacterium]